MTTTYTSKPVMLANLPEVSSISGKFVYNFFKADERIIEDSSYYGNSGFFATSTSLTEVASAGSMSIGEAATQNDYINVSNITDSALLKYYDRNSKYPRLNQIEITPPDNVDSKILTQTEITDIKKILNYVNASTQFNRIGLSITNTEIDTSLASSLRVNEAPVGTVIDQSYPETDAIIKNLIDPTKSGYVYSDNQADEITSDLSKLFLGVSFNSSLLPNVANDVLTGSLSSYKNVHTEELISAIRSVKSAQEDVISRTSPYKLRESDYEQTFPALNIVELTRSTAASNTLKNYHVGFVVEKYSLNFDGSVKIYDSKIYTSTKYQTFIDPDVAYGRSYRYRIRCLYVCEFEATMENNAGVVGLYEISTPFVSNGKDVVIDCLEQVAPPPPVDLKFRFRGEDQGLILTWGFPVNMTRDIKKFHVYKRSSTSVPFQLMSVIDFDDSVIKTEDPDLVTENLSTNPSGQSTTIIKSILPITMFRDTSFTKDSKSIYAIVAVDAHGLSSNYSVQLEASYDKYRNRIFSRVVSRSGAPRPYPNIYLNVDTFVDTMKLSGYKKINIYFDPDYAKVQQTNPSTMGMGPGPGSSEEPVDLEHIVFSNSTDDDNVYKLMIVNTDMQKSQTVTLRINDSYIDPASLVGTTSRVATSPEGTSSGPFSRSTRRART